VDSQKCPIGNLLQRESKEVFEWQQAQKAAHPAQNHHQSREDSLLVDQQQPSGGLSEHLRFYNYMPKVVNSVGTDKTG
jgi:hypothetical protein